METETLKKISTLIRYYILTSTTEAGSGHPTSSLSAVELMVGLMFGNIFRFDISNPKHQNNDRLIFSKGHAAPLFYSLYTAAGAISFEELRTLRKFTSRLEGHPTMQFPYTEAATGSLGQGLSVGVGMALYAKYITMASYRTFVLLGDSEIAEGSVWEAIQISAHYKLNNLVGVIDVNRLGQRGETMYGHDIEAYKKRIRAFGWHTITIDGHSLPEIAAAYKKALRSKEKPVMIIAKTIKGKGVSFLEDKNGWHGKALAVEELRRALAELGDVDFALQGVIKKPQKAQIPISKSQFPNNIQISKTKYQKGDLIATRKVYGDALIKIFPDFPHMVVLDAEVSNATFSEAFKNAYPDRFFEMFIAEQNMVSAAVGLSKMGAIPFVSSFGAFLTRAFDQIRMSRYSGANIKFVGSHVGVSIGEDGISQMGLEDIAMVRTLLDSVVLYPADAVSMEKLVAEAARHSGIVYLRTTRKNTSVIYEESELFPIGGSKVLRQSAEDVATIVGAGITVHEALAAYEILQEEGIHVRVIDLYSVKPLDVDTLKKAARETGLIITAEDHYEAGGIGEAVARVLVNERISFHALAVKKIPKSGTPEELVAYEEISCSAIVNKVKEIVRRNA